MATIEEVRGKTGTSFKVSWDLPRVMVPTGQKRAKGSTTLYDLDQAEAAKRVAEAHKHAITGPEVFAKVVEQFTPAPVKLTVGEWAGSFLRLKEGEVKSRTLKGYHNQLNDIILPCLGSRPLEELTGMEIKNFLDDLRSTRKITFATCDRYFALIKHMLAVAVSNGKVDFNQALVAGWKLGKQDQTDFEEEHAERFLEPEQYHRLCAQFRSDFRLFVEFLCETGARFSEVTSLRVKDLVFENNSAWIRTVLNGDGDRELPKSGKKRLIDVPDSIMIQVQVLVSGKNRDDLVFTSSKGMQINNPNFRRDHWNPAMVRLQQCPKHLPERVDGRNGLMVYDPHSPSSCNCLGDMTWTTFTPHALRHTYATWMLRSSRSITLVSKQLGHSSTRVTETVYAHLEHWWKHDKEARLSNTLDEVLGRKRVRPVAV